MLEPAPLIETPQAKAPAGAKASWFTGAGGAKLRAAIWTPAGRPRGSIVLSGGRSEPIEKYYEVVGELLDRGLVVLAHDWRGQGLSHRELPDRLKGHARGYRAYLDDFRALLGAYGDQLPKPWVAVGHSMGGCLTLLAMAHGEDRFAGALLSAPMLGLKTPFPTVLSRALTSLSVMAGQASRYTLGGGGKPFDATFEGNALTHDRARFERTAGLIAAEPKLALGAPTWGWVDFALRATAFLSRPSALRDVTVPVVILSAGEDSLVDTAAQAAAARHLPQGQFITVPGAYHEILMETDSMRNPFLRMLDGLLGRTAPKPAEPPRAAAATPPVAAPAPAPATAAPPSAAATSAAPKPAANTAVAKKASTGQPSATKAPTRKAPGMKKPAKKPAAKKPAAKKPAAKKAPAKKTAAKKPAAKKAAPKAAAVKKAPAAKKPAAKKPAAKKAPAKKVAAKKPAAKKPAAKAAAAKKPATAKKPAAKKPAAKKPAAKK